MASTEWEYKTVTVGQSQYGAWTIQAENWQVSGMLDQNIMGQNYAGLPGYLNGLGKEGWEMVGMSTLGNQVILVFKRPTPQPEQDQGVSVMRSAF